VPELDYMVLADYVRQDGGVIHIMGAGVDTVTAPVVPSTGKSDRLVPATMAGSWCLDTGPARAY